jgi:hypothetical protein
MNISCENFKDHEDEGRWRSYDLETEGETLEELLANAVYWQIDQDGGSLGEVEADDDHAVDYITKEFNRIMAERSLADFEYKLNQKIDEEKERKTFGG